MLVICMIHYIGDMEYRLPLKYVSFVQQAVTLLEDLPDPAWLVMLC